MLNIQYVPLELLTFRHLYYTLHIHHDIYIYIYVKYIMPDMCYLISIL